jgi:putative ABC transport system permease protein
MRLVALAYLYARRLRTHPVQELLAGAGIAIGVALTFAVQVANHSVTGSAAESARSITGSAALQLAARSPAGVDERIVARVRRIQGVRRATGLLEQRAVVVLGDARAPVHVAGVEPGINELGGLLPRQLQTLRRAGIGGGVILSQAVADELGSHAQPRRVRLELRGRSWSLPVTAIPTAEHVGAFTHGRAIVMRRSDLQRRARQPGRVTRVLVQVEPGAEDAVHRALAHVGAGRLTVGAPTDDVALLHRATQPADRATAFFTLIAALVGWLLAFNAMLLSAQERRRDLVELRMQGFRKGQLVQIALFQALMLGAIASAIGVTVGMLLAHGILHESADYLTGAFSFGTQTVVPRSTLALTFVGGIAAACLASAPPLLALRHGGAVSGDRGASGALLGSSVRRRMLAVAGAILGATGALLLLAGSTTIAAIVGLALAIPLALPAIFAGVVNLGERVSAGAGSLTLLVLALFGLRAATLRSLALAATGALAVFGSVAVASARDDLLRGIDRFADGYTGTADLWITQGDDQQATRDFPAGGLPARLASLPDVTAVRLAQGGFLDVGDRRVWIVAPPPGGPLPIPASEIERGDPARLDRRLRSGRWIVVSEQLAKAQGASAGGKLALPTPSGVIPYRIAATTTNFGWSAGAIVIDREEYRRAWGLRDPTALQIEVRPGASAPAVAAAVRRELGPRSALVVQTAAERARSAGQSARAGLSRLGQIAILLLVGAALAMAAAMSAAIWQRRASLAALRLQSVRPGQLWTVLLAESAMVLGAGCATGALAAVYGQFLIDRYLRLTTGFAAPFKLAGLPAIEAFAGVMAMALLAIAIPGWLAARAPARLGLQE